MISPETAQKIVDAIMELIGNRSVNVMNQQGVILASGEKDRVGDRHKGALDAIRLGRTVEITQDQQWQYPGSRPGVNMPIVIDGETVGAVGILGNPEEVRGFANLVRVCVQLIIEQAMLNQKTQMERELRVNLIHRLIRHPDDFSSAEMREEFLLLNLDSTVCRRAAVLQLSQPPRETPGLVECLEKVEKHLLRQGLVIPGEDLYGMIRQEYVVFRPWHTGADPSDSSYLQRVCRSLKEHLDMDVKGALGGIYPDAGASGYAWSYNEAARLCDIYSGGIHNLSTVSARVDSLIHCIPPDEVGRMLGEIRRRLFEHEQGDGWVRETISAYFAAGMNIQKAAESIHIHKNTMVYRMKRLTELAGLEEENRFHRDFILYLLLREQDPR